MENKLTTILKAATLVTVIGITAGCASSGEMKQMMEDTKAAAESAKQSASTALQTAQDAKSAADRAQQTADQALQSAAEANNCCQQTNEKIDRMFKKTMVK